MDTESSTSSGFEAGARAMSVVHKVWDAERSPSNAQFDDASAQHMSAPTRQRRSESLSEIPFNAAQLIEEASLPQTDIASTKDTVLYLAYGSNMCAATFRGSRGIKPLSQLNVLVPELELSFDLPGIPYSEPCFANTRNRTPPPDSLREGTADYHKDRWRKGLVGVVYEVTKSDYATIIATEGGGAGYQDIVVQCYELPAGTTIVDPVLTTEPFKAHTLFAPSMPPAEPGHPPPSRGGRISRPDPSYAQPSARYLGLLITGAAEHGLPGEYKTFLAGIRPYRITTARQRVGKVLFLGVWMPIILAVLGVGKFFADKKGRLPKWMVMLTGLAFSAVWWSYDGFYRKAFGDGERTLGEEEMLGEKRLGGKGKEREPLLGRRRESRDSKV